MRLLPLLALTACASAPTRGPVEKLPVRRQAKASDGAETSHRFEEPTAAISALAAPPADGELPKIIDTSLRIELDNGRGGKRVRVGSAFTVHGQFQADDRIRFVVTDGRSRVQGAAVDCPQRATRRSGAQVQCRGRGETLGASIRLKKGKYRFKIVLHRGGQKHRLRAGQFKVFPCSFGLCIDKDFRAHEHWAEFVGDRLTFRVTIKRRRALPALHANPKLQARAKPAMNIETMTTRCTSRRKPAGEGSESFEVIEDDGVWTTYRVRTGLSLPALAELGPAPIACRVNINGKHSMQLRFTADENGRPIVPREASSVTAPWFWVKAKRARSLDRKAQLKVGEKAAVLWRLKSLD